MRELIEIFNAIGNEPTRTGKEKIIWENRLNESFLSLLAVVYDPKILTGISKKKLNKKISEKKQVANKMTNLFHLLLHLQVNNTGKDEDIAITQSFINNLETKEEKDFVSAIVIKDLKIGITSKTINKALGFEFIEQFDVMRASRYEGEPIGKEFALTIKEDGIHCVAFNRESGVEFLTRQGEPILGMKEIEEEIKQLPINHVYCGELLAIVDGNVPSGEVRRKTASIVNSDGEKKGLTFNIFDNLPIEEFENGKSKLDYKNRIAWFDGVYYFSNHNLILVRPVVTAYIGENEDIIEPLLNAVLKSNKEGLMINTMDGFYEIKRSKEVMKVKKFYNVDLEVIGFNEHKNKNKMGSFVVDYKGNKLNVPVHKHDDQINLWNQREELIGRVIEVKYFEESKNKKGGISLSFPTFACLREVGKEVSYD